MTVFMVIRELKHTLNDARRILMNYLSLLKNAWLDEGFLGLSIEIMVRFKALTAASM
jgi:hypothetical protein